MVAYSFKAQFEAPIVARTKRQTVRKDRKRNPRVGEPLQLYAGMRTRHCRKIIPDPVCTECAPIEIDIDPKVPGIVASIRIYGEPLTAAGIERFARADGFEAKPSGHVLDSARRAMGEFWLGEHGAGQFMGALIRWEDQ